MACINPNTPEFKAALERTGNPLLAEIEVSKSLEIKPGVEELFNSNPELANIGTQEQYSQYINNIFPDSQVKDIVYHGSRNADKFDNFDDNLIGELDSGFFGKGIYFSPGVKYAQGYANQSNNKTGQLYAVIVNLQNPLNTDANQANKNWGTDVIKNYDGALVTEGPWLNPEINGEKPVDYDPNTLFEIVVKSSSQTHILGSKQDIEGFKEFVDGKTTTAPVTKEKNILYSIKTKSVEEIAKGLNTELVRSEQQIKYSGYIKTMVLNLLGDIGPGKKLNMSPNEAFKQTKEKFIEINNNIALSLNSYVKSEEDLQTFKSSELYNEMLEFLPVLGYVNTYEDLQKAAAIYNNVVSKFDTYVNFVKIDLAHNGIRIVKNKIKNVDNEELAVKNEDENNINIS